MSNKGRSLRFQLERRTHSSPLAQAVFFVVGLVAALLISGVLIYIAKADVLLALASIFRGAFGGWEAFLETLVQSTPILFTGLAVVLAFRGRVWNIGAEGQFFAGAVMATLFGVNLSGLPAALLVPALIILAMVGGAIWGLIPGILKAAFNTSEIIVTVMMNYIMMYLTSFLLTGPLKEPGQHFMQSPKLPASASLPLLFADNRLHLGFALAVVFVLFVYLLLFKTPLGFDIRAIGENPLAARYKGINTKTTIVLAMLLSGAIAGLAGGSEVLGLHHRLRLDISVNYGYTGIIIALLGKLNPFGVLIAAVFFGALVNGSTSMMIYTGVPVALVYSVQGLVLICVLTAEVASKYRIRRVSTSG